MLVGFTPRRNQILTEADRAYRALPEEYQPLMRKTVLKQPRVWVVGVQGLGLSRALCLQTLYVGM